MLTGAVGGEVSELCARGFSILALSPEKRHDWVFYHARWVGHSSTRMIKQIYAQLRDKFKEAEMNKIKLNIGNGISPNHSHEQNRVAS